MAIRLFVGNLPYNVTEAELREHFSIVGPLSYISIPTDRETGKQRGFAFLEFQDRAQADEAIRSFNNQLFKGRPLSINEARARDDRPRTSAPPRPSFNRPDSNAEPETARTSGASQERNFGPDATPHRNRSKTKGGPRSERAAKGPMREVLRGQFSSADDSDDDFDDFDDFIDSESDETDGENSTQNHLSTNHEG